MAGDETPATTGAPGHPTARADGRRDMATYYAITHADGPISIRLESTTKAEAIEEFEDLEPDAPSNDAEADLGISVYGLDEAGFAQLLRSYGWRHVSASPLGVWHLWEVIVRSPHAIRTENTTYCGGRVRDYDLTRDGLHVYDLDPKASELWVVAGPDVVDPRTIDPDALPLEWRWVENDEWQRIQEASRQEEV